MIINIPIDDILTTDCKVLNCNLEGDRLTIVFDSIVQGSTKERINGISLDIFGWSELRMGKFLYPTPFADGHWVATEDFEPLATVDIIRLAGNRITLEGCSPDRRGWLKYDIFDSKYEITAKKQLD